MAADAGAGAEGVEAEGLGLGAADDIPDVDPDVVAEDGHLVGQGDVDVPEVGLQQLDGLRLAQTPRAHDAFGEAPVEGGGGLGAGGGEAADHLGGVGQGEVSVAGVGAPGGVGEVEIAACAQAGFLQDRPEEPLGGAGVGGRFEHDGGVRPQLRGERTGGGPDRRQVQYAVLAQRCRRADHGGADPAQRDRVGGGPEAAGEHSAYVGGGQGAGGDAAGVDGFDGGCVGVVADDAEPGGGGRLREGESGVAESDDSEVCGHGAVPLRTRARMAPKTG